MDSQPVPNDAPAEPAPHRASRLHPFFVAAPLLAWTASFGLDLASHFGPAGNTRAKDSERAMEWGLGAAAVSGAFGLYDWVRLRGKGRAKGAGAIHVALNVVTALLYGASALRRGAIAAAAKPVAPESGAPHVAAGPDAVPGSDTGGAALEAGRVTNGDLAASAAMIVLLAAIGAAGGRVAAKTRMPGDA